MYDCCELEEMDKQREGPLEQPEDVNVSLKNPVENLFTRD